MKGDLHTHSYYSDGVYSPAEVVRKAVEAGCDFMALTDHDTVEGVAEADEAAAKEGIYNVHGVELSSYCGMEVHILGYGIDVKDDALLRFLSEQQERRRRRAAKILQKLAEYRMPVPDGYFEGKVRNVISRSHLAKAIADLGYEPDFFTAMRKWLKDGAPTFVPNDGVLPEEAIAAVHAAGGYAVLAHPVRLQAEGFARVAFIERLEKAGLDGIEAVYKHSSPKAVRTLRSIAKRCGLFVTAGADYHGDGNDIIPKKCVVPFIGKVKRKK